MAKKQATIYLDHAAATPVDLRVVAAMKPYFSAKFANPSALYADGVLAREAIEKSREVIANFFKTQSDCVYFTSGGTESNNAAILGVARKQNKQNRQNKHVITTAIEHSSVLEPIRQLEKEGWSVTYLPVNKEGIVSVEDVKKALRPETMLVSVMYANNEIGSVQPIADIGRMILQWRKNNKTVLPYFHVDACQATEYLPIEVDALHADLLTINGAKAYGPKGVGVLFKRRGVEIVPLMYGGSQERGLRSGTENVPGIVGLGKAIEIVVKRKVEDKVKVEKLRDYFWKRIRTEVKNVELNGPAIDSPSTFRGRWGRPARHASRQAALAGVAGVGLSESKNTRLPNNLNIYFPVCDSEALILYLSARGVAVSAGSACSTDSQELSHVLLACGYNEARIKNSIRFTLGRINTKKDIDSVMKVLPDIVEMIRKMS